MQRLLDKLIVRLAEQRLMTRCVRGQTTPVLELEQRVQESVRAMQILRR